MKLKPELEVVLRLALEEAGQRRHEFAGLEHLLYALCHDPETRETLSHAGASVEKLKQALRAFFDAELEPLPEEALESPSPTLGFQRVIQRAAFHCQSSGQDAVGGPNVLVALFAEADSHAVQLLEAQGVSRLDVVSFLSHGVSKRGEGLPMVPEGEGFEQRDDDEAPSAAADPLAAYCVDLNAEAEAGRIDPLIGRERELERCIHILARRRKNNPIFVGDPGVGKTALVEGLAARVVAGQVPEALRDTKIYSLDMGSLLAGTRYRGDFESRMKGVLKSLEGREGAILFIDEIHTLIGAGAAGGSAMDASNLLKPALGAGRLRCIGSTTYKEFRSTFEKDAALARRFQKIEVKEPSEGEAVQILRGLQGRFEDFHGVRYSVEAIEEAASLARRYLHDRMLPDSALDLVDEAGAAVKLATPGGQVDSREIERVVARIAQIPARRVGASDRERLASLGADLRRKVYGQDEAIERVVQAIKLSRAGLRAPEKPIGSFLFTGPTGVGKTEVARQISETMGIAFVRFDMSEYREGHTVSRLIGAPPGYVGFDQGGLLTEAVTRTPHAVVLLDEIEKAHPDIFNLLLQVMDHGTLTDHNGKKADFRHVVLIMTSNVGARELSRQKIGFGDGMNEGADDRAFEQTFSPEFRNRLDARVAFHPLQPEVMEQIVEKFVAELGTQLAERGVEIVLAPAARRWLAEAGYDPKMGARPLARVLEERLKLPLGDAILFGALEHGGVARVDLDKEGALRFDYEAAPPKEEQATRAPLALEAPQEGESAEGPGAQGEDLSAEASEGDGA